jgi:uncharacterized lipoprotein NlpE involved in copper resistance
MKYLLMLLVIFSLVGCNNLVDLTVEKTKTTTTKTIKEKGKPDIVVVTVVEFLKEFNVIDKSFTVGTKGLGTYYFSICRDLSVL